MPYSLSLFPEIEHTKSIESHQPTVSYPKERHKQIQRTLTLIPTITIHPSRITYHQEIQWNPNAPARKKREIEEIEEIEETKETEEIKKPKYEHLLTSARSAGGVISTNAQRKLLKSLDYLLLIANPKVATSNFSGRSFTFKIAFVTLTLSSPQRHSDKVIKEKLLNQFLVEIRKRYKVKNYIWRAEKQKNGNIHFHIIIDKFIPWSELRDRWNRIQEKLGYVTEYRTKLKEWHAEGFKVRKDLLKKWPAKAQYKAYLKAKKNDFNSPNSTDVHSTKNIHNIKFYISKYLSKNAKDMYSGDGELLEHMKVQGRLWGCNVELSNIKGAKIHMDTQSQSELQKLIDTQQFNHISDTYYTVTFVPWGELELFDCNVLFKAFANYMLDKFDFSIQRHIPI